MNTESFVDIYKYIAEEVETRPLPKGKNKKVIGLMKDELGGKIMRKSSGLRAQQMTIVKIKKQKEQKNL